MIDEPPSRTGTIDPAAKYVENFRDVDRPCIFDPITLWATLASRVMFEFDMLFGGKRHKDEHRGELNA
jgi:hypothetical protein